MKLIAGLLFCLMGCDVPRGPVRRPELPNNTYAVVCYSGGEKIYIGFTDQYRCYYGIDWIFTDNESGYKIETSADCFAAKIK